MNWNERIKQQREEKGLKPAAFAGLIGVSGATISDWESGVIKQISGKYLVKAAAVLGVTPEWIITGLGSPDGRPQPEELISDEQRELWALWQGLLDAQRESYLERLKVDVEKNNTIFLELEKKRLSISNRRKHNSPFSHPGWRKDDKAHGN